MGKVLFRIARIRAIGAFVGLIFAYCPFLVPIKKIMQNAKAVSFPHPSPSYPNHILIIPRRIARDVFCLSPSDFIEVISMAIKIRESNDGDFALIINGGSRQEVIKNDCAAPAGLI